MSTSKRAPTLSKAEIEKMGYNQAKAGYKSALKLAKELGMAEKDIPSFVQGMKNYASTLKGE